MATFKKTADSKSVEKAKVKQVIKSETHKHSDLEKKVADLEATLVKVRADLAAHCVAAEKAQSLLEAKCNENAAASSAGSSSAVEENVNAMWKWLQKDRIFRATILKK